MAVEVRDRILTQARVVLAMGGRPTVDDFARSAGVSRATFYRAFKSKDALLDALERTPEPATRERVLQAAIEMAGEHGIGALSMDDLADRAQVSRATVYRLFPGKPALFAALVHAYSPLDPVVEIVTRMQNEPPELVMPEIARTVYRTFYGDGESRIGLLRSLFFEVSGLSPDTEETAREAIGTVVGVMTLYVVSQMQQGRLRQAQPFLALQSFIGPIFFHLLTRPFAQRALGLELDGEQAVTELAQTWLRAMAPEEVDR